MNDISLVAAWWGALIATVVLLFDLYKWAKSGPSIMCESNYGWKIMMEGIEDDNEYIYFTVTNTGDRLTTITKQAAAYWDTKWATIFSKPKQQFFIKGGLHGLGKVPMIIKPGEIWISLGRIGEDIRGLMDQGGYLYLSLYFSHRRRPLRFKVAKGKKKTVALP